MEFLKHAFLAIVLASSLSGCVLTEEDKKKIDKASVNLEKVANAPLITSPAENDSVTGIVPIKLDMDNSTTYKTVSLLVNGKQVSIDEEAPYDFNLDTSSWNQDSKITILVIATTDVGTQLRSEVRTLNIGEQDNSASPNGPLITFPADDDTVRGVTPVRFFLNESITYKSVSLIVDGEVLAVDDEAPFGFDWDSYFWTQNSKATLLVVATTEKGDQLRSGLRTLNIDRNSKNLVSITSPTNNKQIKNANSVLVVWTARTSVKSYEYRVNGVATRTDETSARVALPQTGDYSLAVRAIDEQGHKGQWSDPKKFTLALPAAPQLRNLEPVEREGDWQVLFDWNGAQGSSEFQIATDKRFASILENEVISKSSYTASLVTGIYYARVRTTNEFGHVSEWSEAITLNVGLFSAKIDMNSYGGFSNADAPVDFVIEDESLVISARASNDGDSTGDDFYVSKVNLQGGELWGKSYLSQINRPKTIAKTSSGYVLAGIGINSNEANIIALDDLGNKSWLESYGSVEDLNAGKHGTFTIERIKNIIEVSPSRYVALQRTLTCIYTAPEDGQRYRPWACPSENVQNKVKFIDRIKAEIVITDHQTVQPKSGKYDQFSQLLLTDSGLYAAGRYTAANDSSQDSSADGFIPSASASGAVLLKLDKEDGSITSTRTAGGIKDTYLSSIADTESGDIVVGYNSDYAAVTSIFKSDNGSDRKIDGSQRYTQVVADPNGDGYITMAQHRNSDAYYLTRYDDANNKVGESTRLSQCFSRLRPKKIKNHPKHGLVILGTDGSSYSNTHTVYFNVSKDFKYICPE